MALYERAERNRQPLTVIFLDIKKAYDSVERGAGKAVSFSCTSTGATLTGYAPAGKPCGSVKTVPSRDSIRTEE